MDMDVPRISELFILDSHPHINMFYQKKSLWATKSIFKNILDLYQTCFKLGADMYDDLYMV